MSAAVMSEAPDGGRLPSPMLVADVGAGFTEMTCSDCGQQVTFVNATAQRVQWYTTSHHCGGHTWQARY